MMRKDGVMRTAVLLEVQTMSEINWDEMLLPYEQAVHELTVKFRCLRDGFDSLGLSSPIESVEGRVKRVSSILEKAQRKEIQPQDIEQKIEDIAGIRIICRFVEDIARVVQLIEERDGLDMDIIKERDYVSSMKPSGYRSFHLIIRYPVVTALGKKFVFCEIQIRTMAMNFWAVIEHSLRYKYNGKMPDEIKRRLVRSADAAFLLDREVSEIRQDIIRAERDVVHKENVVNELVQNIQLLYRIAPLDEAERLNKEFMALHDGQSDDEQLVELNRRVRVIAESYRMRNA